MAVGTLAVRCISTSICLVPFLGDTALAILGVGLAPVAACDVHGKLRRTRTAKQRRTSEEKADPSSTKRSGGDESN
jgi:hypothetical protein